jgi:hypothetical protein
MHLILLQAHMAVLLLWLPMGAAIFCHVTTFRQPKIAPFGAELKAQWMATAQSQRNCLGVQLASQLAAAAQPDTAIVNAIKIAATQTVITIPCSALKAFWNSELDCLKQDS